MNEAIKSKKWLTSIELAQICSVNKRTVQRKRIKLLKKNIHTDWFKTESKPFMYNYKFIGEFNPKILELVEENQNANSRNKQLCNTIKLLPETYGITNPERTLTLEQYLYLFDWDYFITIAYQESLPQMECYILMHNLYDHLEKSRPNKLTRMFFTTEPFTNRKGYHNHFILKSQLSEVDIQNIINQITPDGRIDIRKYDKELAGTFYINKESRKGKFCDITNNQRKDEGWDIIGNKLKMEALRLANKRLTNELGKLTTHLNKIEKQYKSEVIKERYLGFKSRMKIANYTSSKL